jgi:uncharacterized protein
MKIQHSPFTIVFTIIVFFASLNININAKVIANNIAIEKENEKELLPEVKPEKKREYEIGGKLSPLVNAAREERVFEMEDLLKSGENPNQNGEDMCTALYTTCFYDKEKSAKKLLDWGANPNLISTKVVLKYPLEIAIKNSSEELIKTLLEHGADPNLYSLEPTLTQNIKLNDIGGRKQRVTKLLLDYGANPRLERKRSEPSTIEYDSPFLDACRRGDSETIKIMAEYIGKDITKEVDALSLAVLLDDKKTAEVLLKLKINPNDESKRKNIPILLCKSKEMLKLLLNYKGNINRTNKWGETLTYQAVLSRDDEMLKALLYDVADVNIETKSGDSPIKVAKRQGREEVVNALLKAGANTN